MTDVYENCPVFENDSYILRMTSQQDKSDLLKVYSDKAAVSFFNSDNCGSDDFYYTRYGLFYGQWTAQIGYPERLRKSRRNYKNIENDHRTRVNTLSLR
ncbi:hypothetical protein [Hungatella hominis]|uniref:hypothetical protein n=1 Tax=Hungatella hominis TaxID=2763050 RepID=UPI0032E3A70D